MPAARHSFYCAANASHKRQAGSRTGRGRGCTFLSCRVRSTNERGETMTIKLVALALCLMTGPTMAQETKVTELMSKVRTESRGRTVLMMREATAVGGWRSINRQ